MKASITYTFDSEVDGPIDENIKVVNEAVDMQIALQDVYELFRSLTKYGSHQGHGIVVDTDNDTVCLETLKTAVMDIIGQYVN